VDPLSILTPDLFAGKTVFVTGGGSGIGLAIARGFAERGAAVSICGRSQERLDNAVRNLRHSGSAVMGVVADVRDSSAVETALASSREAHGPADVVVCAAAGNFLARAEHLSASAFRTVIDIDLNGSFFTARAAFEQLCVTRGSLLFISAGQAFVPFSRQVHAGAAKAGIENLMRNLALEWGRHGIRSNSIVPGPIADTEGARRLSDQIGAGTWAGMIPLGRFGALAEIAAMALVLSSPLADYVTGATIVVDGGYALTGSGEFAVALDASEAHGVRRGFRDHVR
jgi:NAD(P)-dependent dehydrogenase (short-subunit alcohol dehydrogenase family)